MNKQRELIEQRHENAQTVALHYLRVVLGQSAIITTEKTGSALYGYTDNPGDYDILARVPSNAPLSELVSALVNAGWKDCAHVADSPEYENEDGTYGEKWVAVRRNEVNIIITNDDVWYIRMQAAAMFVKHHPSFRDWVGTPPCKDDIRQVFRMVRDGMAD